MLLVPSLGVPPPVLPGLAAPVSPDSLFCSSAYIQAKIQKREDSQLTRLRFFSFFALPWAREPGTVRAGASHSEVICTVGQRVVNIPSHPASGGETVCERCTWSTWSAVINRTSRAGELRSAPSGPDDCHRVNKG